MGILFKNVSMKIEMLDIKTLNYAYRLQNPDNRKFGCLLGPVWYDQLH